MMKVSRRDIILSSAAAATVFGLDKRVVLIGAAEAQQKAPTVPAVKPFYNFNVGKFKVTMVYDGDWAKPHDAGFIKNASIDDTKKALQAAKLTDAYVPISFTVPIINTGKNLVMFDAGTGGQLMATAGKLADNMKAAKIDATKIDTIIITHFHGDHITGLMAKDTNAPIYPNAKIYMPEAEYAYWTNPTTTSGAAKRIQAVFPAWKEKGYLIPIKDNQEVLPGIKSLNTNGHTPGHTSFHVSSGKSQFVVLGDVSNIPSLFVKNPGWQCIFDIDPVAAEKTRRTLYDRVVAEKLVVAGYHFGLPAGTMRKDGQGYAFVPLKA